MLKRLVPNRFRILIYLSLLILPIVRVAIEFDSETYFTYLIRFGSTLNGKALKEVRDIPRAFGGEVGYDGQHYAQIAIDPSLKNPQLQFASDDPPYRSRRIFVPALCYLLGLGKPWLILQVYALINLLFYALLLYGLVYFLKPNNIKHMLCVIAIMWTTGCLISIERALLDLPAAVLIFYASCLENYMAFPFFAMALLTKETSLFSIAALPWSINYNLKDIGKMLSGLGVVLIPFFLWVYYVHHVFNHTSIMGNNLGIPFVAFSEHMWHTVKMFYTQPNEYLLFELLAPLSLMLQALYLLRKVRFSSHAWRMGIGFAILFFFLGKGNFPEQISYCRIVLPLTFAFNLILMESEEKYFISLFLFGNIGLFWQAYQMLSKVF
jgi:hypothetical protein